MLKFSKLDQVGQFSFSHLKNLSMLKLMTWRASHHRRFSHLKNLSMLKLQELYLCCELSFSHLKNLSMLK